MSVVVCTDISGKEPYRQVAVTRVVTSGSLGDEMISTLTHNARDMGLIPALGVHTKMNSPSLHLKALTLMVGGVTTSVLSSSSVT